jgi:hypothetical protein
MKPNFHFPLQAQPSDELYVEGLIAMTQSQNFMTLRSPKSFCFVKALE